MFKRIPGCFGWLLMTVLACTPVAAQNTPVAARKFSPDWKRCVHEGKEFSLDEQIGTCTAVLQSARETPSNLAIAYQARLKAYRDKQKHDRHNKR